MRTLLAVDEFVTTSTDARLAGISVAVVFRLTSVRGFSVDYIAGQIGCTPAALTRSIARFRALAGIDSEWRHPTRSARCRIERRQVGFGQASINAHQEQEVVVAQIYRAGRIHESILARCLSAFLRRQEFQICWQSRNRLQRQASALAI
jgi:hypothetical protein